MRLCSVSKQVDIVCIKHGDSVYSWEYVDKLYRGVQRSLTAPFNFTVFTDTVDNSKIYNQIQLPNIPDLIGRERGKAAWWYKTWLFSNEHELQRQLIYFDLDVMITGNCDFLHQIEHDKFGMVAESKWSTAHHQGASRTLYNTSVMVLNPVYHNFIWTRYIRNRELIQSAFHGDQNFINHLMNRQGLTYNKYLVALDPQKIVYWFWDVVNGGIIDREVIRSEDNGNGTIKIREARCRWVSPGVDKLKPEMSVVIFDGYKYKPELLVDRPIVKEYWV